MQSIIGMAGHFFVFGKEFRVFLLLGKRETAEEVSIPFLKKLNPVTIHPTEQDFW
jgi:hypothetical protein